MKKLFLIATLLASFSNLLSQNLQNPPPPGCDSYYVSDNDNDGFATFDINYYINTYFRNKALTLGYNLSGYNLSLFPTETDYNNNTNVIGATYINQVNTSQQCSLKLIYSGSGISYDQATLDYLFSCHFLKTVNPNLDDDGDTVLNRFEDLNNDTTLNNEDTDLDGILNFKDADDDGDNVLSINEDYNHNGSILDDDTNSNGIADYLDSAVTLNTASFVSTENIPIYPTQGRNNLTIDTEHSDYLSVEILDLSGKVLAFRNENVTNIDVSGFESGIYFIRINWIDKSKNFKIIKL